MNDLPKLNSKTFDDHLDLIGSNTKVIFESTYVLKIGDKSFHLDDELEHDRLIVAQLVCKAMEAYEVIRHRVNMQELVKGMSTLMEAFDIPNPNENEDVQPSDC